MNEKSSWYVVTGASQGIGFETAFQLTQHPGIHVLAISRNGEGLKKLQEKSGTQLHILNFDLEKDDFSEISAKLKSLGASSLHGIVNNAGFLINKPFLEIQSQELEKSYRVNLFGPFLLIQQLLPLLKLEDGAHILNISSMGGVQGSAKFSGLSAYSSGKGALNILTECLAEEFSAFNIKVNCLALGAVQTEMLSAAFPNYKAPLSAKEMGEFISWFLLNGQRFFNGKILPVAISTP